MKQSFVVKRVLWPTALLVLLFAFIGFGAEPELLVSKIVIDQKGPVPVREDVVRASIRLTEGSVYSSQVLSKDIENLFESKHFADIEVDVLNKAPDRVELVFKIRSKPRVQDILFVGCDKIKAKKLRDDLKQQKRESLMEGNIGEDVAEIYKKYEKKGYYGTVVRYFIVDSEAYLKLAIAELSERGWPYEKENFIRLFEDEEFQKSFLELSSKQIECGRVHLVYWIFEDPRVVVTDVELENATVVTLRKLKKTHPIQTDWGIFPKYLNEDALISDSDQIRLWYWDHGYFDASVQAVRKEFGKTWLLRRPAADVFFSVKEGERYIVSEIRITGNERFAREELETRVRLQVGQPYTKAAERTSADRIESKYYRLGYLEMRVHTRLEPNPEEKTVVVHFTITEGKPYRIEDIHVTGNRITHDNVIRRELSVEPGDLADKDKIDASRNRLKGLRYFKEVDILSVDGDRPGTKDLHTRVVEDETGRFSASLALSDLENSLVRFEFGQNNFDIFGWDRSFRGGGQRFRITAGFGANQTDYSLNFVEPWFFDRRLRFDLTLWRRETSVYRDWDQKSVGAQVKITKKLPWKFWRTYFGDKLEEIKISDVEETFSNEFIQNETGTELVHAILFGIIRDSRNSTWFPTYGSNIRLDASYQSDDLGSYADLYRLDLSSDTYLPVLKTSVIKFSTNFGQLNKFHGDVDAKVFDRYFAGGSSTIRGFESREAGPVDPGNIEPVGGKSRMLFSTELLTPLYEDTLYSAFFVDAGNVWEGSWDWAFDDMNVGAGFGIRIRLPIGAAISIDYAWPLATRQDHLDDDPRLHFNLGWKF